MKNPFLILLVILGGMLPNLASGASQPVYCGEWGSHGTGPGQFNFPCGIAVDANGDVYVADTYNCRIQKFTSTGAYLTQWGSPGYGAGQLIYPEGIAFDADGNVYVADTYNSRIQKFTSSGEYISLWGGYAWPPQPGKFYYDPGVAVDAGGNVYVSDFNCARVQKFTSSGVYLTEWGSPVGDWPGFQEPRAVAVDISGNVLVGDSYYVTKFTNNGEYISRLGGPGQLGGVSGIAVDASGRVYVADCINNHIQVFTASGVYVTQWGSSGTGPGQFNDPGGVAVAPDGTIYVADTINRRVQIFRYVATAVQNTTWGRIKSMFR